MIDTEITDSQRQRVASDFQQYAGDEPIRFEQIKACFYAFGSELAVLRILNKYRWCKKARAGYIENLQTWFFGLEF